MSDFIPPPQRGDLKWLAVDFDNTIVRSRWTVDNPTAVPGEPIWGNVSKLNAAVAMGYKVWVHTARPWSDYEIVEACLLYHGIHFDGIVCGKLLALAMIDDRGVHESAESWTNGGHCGTCRCS